MLKLSLLDCAIKKNELQWWRRMGHLPSFFVPIPGDLTAQESGLSWKWLLTDALIVVLSQKGDFRTFPLPIFHHLGLNFPYNVPSVNHKLPKLSKLTVTRVECKLHSVTRASRCCVTGDFMRNNTLSSANTKYHYIFPSLQWYKTKEGLPLMNSCVFWSGIISLVDSLAPFCDLCNSTLSTRRRFAARKLI